ncbi:putative speedy protein E7 [Mesoplodon densirostris]|uniref:putative speedy protein E7 n=1 Tax=Mesoplodon densirostris TaxID=48708 RepID=UPI0028DCE64A|nr:putative speedy protein E7 [Mesoplodon densirostris]XP_059972977.1 putative speedy protein E7 [Mesoplodon densirostris]
MEQRLQVLQALASSPMLAPTLGPVCSPAGSPACHQACLHTDHQAERCHVQHTQAAQDGSPLASSSAPPEAVSEQRTRRMRGQKRKRLMDVKGGVVSSAPLALKRTSAAQDSSALASKPTSSEVVSKLKSWKKRSQRRNMWTVTHVEGTKLRINKRRSSYRAEDQEAFYRLLEDPVIQSFLKADSFLQVSDKYLLSMVVEYFGRVGLPGHLYNRIHFFLALYIASDMEEDNPTAKQSIFPFLLGREHWQHLYKKFLQLKVEFFCAMEYRAWVTRELCEEIQAQNPHHWVWSRVRPGAP